MNQQIMRKSIWDLQPGRISHKQAMDKANAEYEIFNRTQPIESDFDKAVKRMIKEQADV